MLSEQDEYLINKDQQLKGLRVLLDVNCISELIKNTSDISSSVRADIKYIRYKPQTNCLVLYDIYVGDNKYPAYAKTYAYDIDIKFKNSKKRKTINWDYGEGRIYEKHTGTEICFFPNDNKLKYLRCLSDDTSKKMFLSSVLSKEISEFNDVEYYPLAYKPERRYVVKVQNDEQVFGVLKFYTKGLYDTALRNTNSFESTTAFTIPRMINNSDEHHVLSYEWVKGELLRSAIAKKDSIDKDLFKELGTCIYVIHNQCSTSDLSVFDKKVSMNEIKNSIDMISYVCPEYKHRFDNILEKLKYCMDDSSYILKPVHGDFNTEQILLNNGEIGIIDFDRASMGHPACDFGTIIAHLIKDEIKGHIKWDQIEDAKDNMARGYGSEIEGEFIDMIDIYTVIGLLNLSPHFFRVHEDNWYKELDVLIEICEQILANIRTNNIYFNNMSNNLKKELNEYV